MRLDHLLSKEHLPPKGGKEPAARRVSGRGAQMAETLVSWGPATAATPSTAILSGVVGMVVVVRLVSGGEHPVGS